MSNDLLEAGLETRPPETRIPVTIERVCAAMALAAICIITLLNVVVRYLTDVSLAFTEEYSIFLMVVMTMFGASVAVAADRHIRITFFAERLPARLRPYVLFLAWGAFLAILGFLIWYGGRLAYDHWRFEETSPALGNPQWLYTIWLPVLAFVMALRTIGRMVAALRGAKPDGGAV